MGAKTNQTERISGVKAQRGREIKPQSSHFYLSSPSPGPYGEGRTIILVLWMNNLAELTGQLTRRVGTQTQAILRCRCCPPSGTKCADRGVMGAGGSGLAERGLLRQEAIRVCVGPKGF